mgnify:CR=1 FL=1|jgi:hypothetical protein|tara:strand:- start:508 stop:831 length:324 start_codon:yes stop_codon:yes gene_type:complete
MADRETYILRPEELCKGKDLESIFSVVKVTGGYSVQIDWSGKKKSLVSLTLRHKFKTKDEALDAIKHIASRKAVTGQNIGKTFIEVKYWIKNFAPDPVQEKVLDYKF